MKIKLLRQKFNSTLSCISKYVGFEIVMICKKIIFGIFIFSFLGGCTSPTTMLGPAYTLTSSGSVFQAGLNYGSNQMITMYTGKTPMENLKDISSVENNEKNIKKNTLESEDFYILVENRIKKTSEFLKLSNQ